MWPQVLDAVKNRRRVTWIVLRENAQVHGFADDVLTLSLNNPGARESLSRGGSLDIVREAILEVMGIAPRIETIAGEDEAPSARSAPVPPRPPQPSPGEAERQIAQASAAPAGADLARANIQTTQAAPEPEPEPTESRDDPDLDTGLNSDELLATYLGAQLIGEEDPEP